ncbi:MULTISPECIES: hypothetical protein [unclassified Streptomyces]|uniref:hypothetical protein n=1 Tax=unclassified Streptomyces TaxID=2593676 RepID=UPI002E76CDCD|nr:MULTISPECIES: hypothetical protein [unclassified Streptomyces]MEE1757872.1 hypothetical protein [Streptomyces sp. SP18BB07]MEE1831796.1 hypothetical protein [Streptomyces sp. SP17KL33]
MSLTGALVCPGNHDLAMFGFGRSIAITVSLTALGCEAPLEPAPRAVEPISVTGRRSS